MADWVLTRVPKGRSAIITIWQRQTQRLWSEAEHVASKRTHRHVWDATSQHGVGPNGMGEEDPGWAVDREEMTCE